MKPQIKYTKTGEEEVNRYLSEQKDLLEEYLLQDKYIIGDEIVEITGSDIVEIKQKLNISYKKPNRYGSLKLASYLYAVFGVIMTILGITYPYFRQIMVSNKEQAYIILAGFFMSFLGIFISIYVKYKEKRQNEIKYRKKFTNEITLV